MLCRPQAVSLVIWEAAAQPHAWLSCPSIWDILDLAVLAKIGEKYLFNKFALRKYWAYSFWALQVIWECKANPDLSLQTGMRGHRQMVQLITRWPVLSSMHIVYQGSWGFLHLSWSLDVQSPPRYFNQAAGDDVSRYIQSYCLQRTHLPSAHLQFPTRSKVTKKPPTPKPIHIKIQFRIRHSPWHP